MHEEEKSSQWMFGGGVSPISFEECICGRRGRFHLTGGDAWGISLLGPFLLHAFASSLRSPPFLSSAERQDGGAFAGYSSFLCPLWVWRMRSPHLLGFFLCRLNSRAVFLVGGCFKKSYEVFLSTVAHWCGFSQPRSCSDVYICECVCTYAYIRTLAISYLVLLTGETNFPRRLSGVHMLKITVSCALMLLLLSLLIAIARCERYCEQNHVPFSFFLLCYA